MHPFIHQLAKAPTFKSCQYNIIVQLTPLHECDDSNAIVTSYSVRTTDFELTAKHISPIQSISLFTPNKYPVC